MEEEWKQDLKKTQTRHYRNSLLPPSPLVFCRIKHKFGPCEENDRGMENVRVGIITITL